MILKLLLLLGFFPKNKSIDIKRPRNSNVERVKHFELETTRESIENGRIDEFFAQVKLDL